MEQVLDHAARQRRASRDEQALDDPVRVPVVRLAEAAAGDDDGVRQREQRALLVHLDRRVDAPEELRPDRVDVVRKLAELGRRDPLDELGVGREVDRLGVHQVDARRLEVALDELLEVAVRRLGRQLRKVLEHLLGVVEHRHVDEGLAVLVEPALLDRAQQRARRGEADVAVDLLHDGARRERQLAPLLDAVARRGAAGHQRRRRGDARRCHGEQEGRQAPDATDSYQA